MQNGMKRKENSLEASRRASAEAARITYSHDTKEV